ncbi:MAG: FkbM family methyltransferase [Pseudomonadota bacterium]
MTSAVRRFCTAGRSGPFDVEAFPGQQVRLYPGDNLCEKRVFAAAQFWDWAEREALAAAISGTPGPFRFVDAGANVGLYSLAVRSLAGGGGMLGLAIEPDPTNLARLRVNLAASDASEIRVVPVALGVGGSLVLADATNRGEIRAVESGAGETVSARPLLDLVREAGLTGIDALKIDIEGAEAPVLAAFFDQAPRALWPQLVIIEARNGEETEALAVLRDKRYVPAGRTKLNGIFTAPRDLICAGDG